MLMFKELAEPVSNFVFGATALAFSASAGTAAMAAAAVPLGVGAATLMGVARSAVEKHGAECQATLDRIRKRLERDWRNDPGFDKATSEQLARASEELCIYLQGCMLNRQELAASAIDLRRFPEAATELVLGKLGKLYAGFLPDGEHEIANATARDFAKAVVRSAFDAAIDNENWFKKFAPYLTLETAQATGELRVVVRDISEKLDTVAGGIGRIETIIVDMAGQIAELRARGVIHEAETRGLDEVQIETVLQRFGHHAIPRERWAEMLLASADQLRDLQAKLSAMSNAEPEIVVLLQRAGKAIAVADFSGADALLAEAESRDLAAGRERVFRAAGSRERRGDLAIGEGRFLDAANHFEAAAGIIENLDRQVWCQLKIREAWAAAEGGSFDADPSILKRAIRAYHAGLTAIDKEHDAKHWASVQVDLGIALSTLGDREGGSERLDQAIDAYHQALTVYTRETWPDEWAKAEHGVASALIKRGGRAIATTKLEQAVDILTEVLKVRSRERDPVLWRRSQGSLAKALSQLGERESNPLLLGLAADAFREATQVDARDTAPEEWASLQHNFAAMLFRLGEWRADAFLLESVAAYRRALEVWTREKHPLRWAESTCGLATALNELGRNAAPGEIGYLKEAVELFGDALEVETRERVPLGWALCQNNLGLVLMELGLRHSSLDSIKKARAAFFAAILEWTEDHQPIGWSGAQMNLGRTFEIEGDIAGNRLCWQIAAAQYQKVIAAEASPMLVKQAQVNLDLVQPKLEAVS